MVFRGSSSFGRASALTLSLLVACAVETQGTSEEQIPLDPFGGSSGSGGSSVVPTGGTDSGGTPGASGTFTTSGSDSGGNPFVGGMFGGGTPSVGGMAGTPAGGGAGGASGGMGGAGGKAGAGGTAGAGGKAGAGGSGGGSGKACGTGKLTITGCTAQSEENAGLTDAQACDGNMGTRWSSAHMDNEWIWFDLAQVAHVGRVQIFWEAAYATSYRLEIADSSNGPWMEISNQTGANGGTDDITNLDDTGRYVRMFGLTRATIYGFSIFELEVYGDLDETCQ